MIYLGDKQRAPHGAPVSSGASKDKHIVARIPAFVAVHLVCDLPRIECNSVAVPHLNGWFGELMVLNLRRPDKIRITGNALLPAAAHHLKPWPNDDHVFA